MNTRNPDAIRAGTYTVSYDTRLNKIIIAIKYATITFNGFTEAEVIATQNQFTGIDLTNLRSINKILNIVVTSPTHGIPLPFVSGSIDLVPVKTLSLHCKEIFNYTIN